MLIALPVSAVALLTTLIFATRYAAKTYIDPNPEITASEIETKLKTAPGAMKSTLPILVPILLIILRSVSLTYQGRIPAGVFNVINFLGEPLIALLMGMFLALLLPKKLDKEMFSTTGWVGKAVKDAASIILITGAGGIFGQMLQDSDIADLLGNTLANVHMSIWLPFLLAAAIKSAQGSSTVAIITAASIMMPMMESLGFSGELQKAMVVLSIGAGSSVVSHANDSFFWVVTQLSGMDVKTGYRLQSLGTLVLGTTAAITLYVIYLFAV